MSGGGVKSRNFRRRSEEDAKGEDMAPSPAAAGAAKGGSAVGGLKTRPPAVSKPRNLLSFADEEESTVGRSTSSRPPSSAASSSKSASVHRITTSKDRVAAAALPKVSSLHPQTGEYTKEKLLELQKNARPLGSFPKPSAQLSSSYSPVEQQQSRPATSETPGEPVIVLRGLENLVKPVAVQKKEERPSVEPQLEENLAVNSEVAGREFSGLDISEEGKDSSLIPDQATINAIRAKRERLRQARTAPDYISLDSGAGTRRSAGGSSDEEDHDFRGRISLRADKTEDASSRKGVFESSSEKTLVLENMGLAADFREVVEEEEEEEDEEERIWEEEQFRKGLGKRFDEASSSKPDNGPHPPAVSAQASSLHYVLKSVSSLEGGYGFSKSAEAMSISQQAEVATRALREGIGKLKEAHGRTLSSLVRTDENLSEALTNITALERSLSAADEKFVFVQKLRDFISILCSFLQDKAPYMEELEDQMQKLHQGRASAIRERREADDADEMVEVEAALAAASSALSRGGSSSALISAAVSAARESLNLPVQMDEFGRDLNRQKRLDMERRAESRKRRKARSESKLAAANERGNIEGEVSTDESESEADAFASSREELLQTAGLVFSDAAEEYSKVSAVKQRFEEWKRLYASSYRDAYMALSTPLLFAPYMRLELLKWDPLHQQSDFCDMQWHDQLFSYGLLQENGGSSFEDSDDPDANLIPVLVEQVALPVLRHEINYCWDVLSARQTENAVFATNLVISYLQPSSKKLTELLAEIVARLSAGAENLGVPAWSASAIRAVPDAARIGAHRFGRSVRLLKNICLWKDILSSRILQELALDLLLARKILPHLRSVMPSLQDAITRTERVVAALGGVLSPKLQPLVDFVMEMGKALEKRLASAVHDETVGLARRLKKMLVQLNEYDQARAILRTFKLKEAL